MLPASGLLLMAGSCATSGSLDVLCQRSAPLEADHAAALAGEASDAAVTTGQAYIATVAAGCGR